MQYKSIRVGELFEFLQSDLYCKLSTLPITRERAMSQLANPRALIDDVVLIIAYNEKYNLLGYIGALPDDIYWGSEKYHIAWNSCWWVDTDNGKAVSMHLFSALYKAWDYKIFFSDLDEKGKIFISYTKSYNISEYPGVRLFMKLYLPQKITTCIPVFSTILKFTSNLIFYPINKSISLFYSFRLRKFPTNFSIESSDRLTDGMLLFINTFENENISLRNQKDFDWIVNNPWIITSGKSKINREYYFSYIAESFSSFFISIKAFNKIVAVILVLERDGHYKLPYLFIEKQYSSGISVLLLKYLNRLGAITITLYFEDICSEFIKNKAYLKFHKLSRYAAFPLKYGDCLKKYIIQDGDGDAVFC